MKFHVVAVGLTWFLSSSSSLLQPAEAKECIVLSRGKELKQLVQDKHVLVSLQTQAMTEEKDNDIIESTDEIYKELCQRFKDTPDVRSKDLDIALVIDSNLKRKVLEEAQLLPTSPYLLALPEPLRGWLTPYFSNSGNSKPAPEYPEYVLYPKNSTTTTTTGPLRLTGPKELENISDMISRELHMYPKLGNFVYSLGTMDMIASKFMAAMMATSTESGATATEQPTSIFSPAWMYTQILARLTRMSVSTMSLSSSWWTTTTDKSSPSFEQTLTEQYWKIFVQTLERGSDYPSVQVKRLENMLEKERSSLTPIQQEQMQQKLYILKRFTEPIDVEDAEWSSLLFRMAMNVGTLVVLVVLLLGIVFVPVEEEEEDDEKDDSAEMEGDKEKEE